MLLKPPSAPRLPGVYIFRDAEGKILYIGKAKSLARRIVSYFSLASTLHEKLKRLREEATALEYIVTRSEQDALLLEEHLVKLYQPPYNVLLATGHPFLYLHINTDSVPELVVTRTKGTNGIYYGPFTNRTVVRRTYDYLMKTFRLYRCSVSMPNGCLKYHLGICAGVCTGAFDAAAYMTRLSLVQQLLEENSEGFKKILADAIVKCNMQLHFEEARQLYKYSHDLQTIFNHIAETLAPQKYHHDVAHVLARTQDTQRASDFYASAEIALQKACGVSTPISTIDCFDISHVQGRYMVGSCIRFNRGIPDRKYFRKFRIKTLQQQNDYAALQEIIQRRYRKTEEIPDLILIDGGKGQLSSAKEVLPNARMSALAKREERFFTELYPQGIVLSPAEPMGRLLITLRDYAHRFALHYHTLLSKKGIHE